MRRKDETLRDTLISLARNIADTEGIDAINIRSIAQKAGITAGTVYNYFSGKDEILLSLTEEYWQQTLLEMNTAITAKSFCEQLQEIFSFLRERIDQSAGKLMNSLGKAETTARERMVHIQTLLEADLVRLMEQDPDIRKDVWDETFTREQFAHFIMMNIMMLLKTKASDCHFFITIVQRTIY